MSPRHSDIRGPRRGQRRRIVAHDLGTSGDKASLHDADGRLLAARTEPYPTRFGPGGTAEQDPAEWWRAFCLASRRLLEDTGTPPDEVACVAMSGQMMGVVLVDGHDTAIRPALIWADTRSHREAETLAERVGVQHGYELLGHPIDPTYCLAKLIWLRDHEPASWAAASGALVAKDYLTLRLTGRRCTDPSDAAGTNAWDQVARTWSAEMLAAAGIDPGILPEVVPSATVAGGLLAAAARGCGLASGTPVVVGGGDGACAALGAGLIGGDGSAIATIGSSAWLSIASDRPLRDPQRRVVTFDHVIPGRFAPLGAMQAAGTAIEWVAGVAGAHDRAALAALVEAARDVRAGGEGLFFLPYLLGERAPLWDARVRGTFVGLARHHEPAHLMRAALEGVAFNLRGTLRALVDIGGPVATIDAIGGGARSDTWLAIMADTWGLPVRRRTIVDEANSLGAAVVGGMAVGLIDDWAAARSLSAIEATFEPDLARHGQLEEAQARFEDAYLRLRTWFR
jgi:xylulokinase